MAATQSTLKAAGALEPSFFGASDDSDYALKYKEAKEAEKKLSDLLQQRNESRVSPSMLALAGELLSPGQTGSFGEAIGRGAKAYGATQGLEDKQLQENAMMQMQLKNMQLENAQGQQFSNIAKPFIQDLLGTGSGAGAPPRIQGAAPKPMPLATPGSTGAPSTPAASGTSPQAVPRPEGASTQSPTITINGRQVNPTIIAGLKMLPATKAIGEAFEFAYDKAMKEREFQQSGYKVQPDYIVNTNTLDAEGKPQVIPIIKKGEADVEIRFPEIGGKVFMGSKEDLMEVREARSKGDMKGVQTVIDRLQYGAKRPTTSLSSGKAPTDGTLDVQAQKEAAIRAEKVAAGTAENEVKDTAEMLKNESTNRESTFIAARIIKNASQNSKMYGILKEPGLGPALTNFIKERGNSIETANITKENLENFLRQNKADVTRFDLTKVAEMSSDLARLHFNYRKVLLQGQGQTSDREDAGVAKIQGTPSDTPEFLIGMAQLVGRRAQFDVDVADQFRKYRRIEGRGKTLEDFKSDPSSSYKKILTGYENWLTKTYNLPQGLTPETTPAQGAITIESIRAAKKAKQNRGE
jgi:hypothetical protein